MLNFDLFYIQISMQIHAEVEISQDKQNGKKSKFDFDLNYQMIILPFD